MRKNVFTIAVAILTLVLSAAADAPFQPPQSAIAGGLGDVNCDGGVESVDALQLLQFGAGLISTLDCPDAGDVNGDDLMNAADAMLILQSVAGFIVGKPATPIGPLGAQGIAYGPFRDGQAPARVYPTTEEIREDLIQLSSVTSKIRTYSSAGPMEVIPPEAAALGFSVATGVFLGPNEAANDQEIAAAIDLANAGFVQSVIVGNETQLFGTVREPDLLAYIDTVRSSVPDNVEVTTAEPWNIWGDRPQLVDAVDYVLMHVHPIWEGKPIDGVAAYVLSKYFEVSREVDDKHVVIGETGWPSGGTPEDVGILAGVVPSEENQRTFLEEFSQLAEFFGIEYYWFAAYDEEWKWEEGLLAPPLPTQRDLSGRFVGSSWGIFRSDGRVKTRLADVFPAASASPSRQVRIIFDGRGLAVGYDMGVDSSQHRQDWLELADDGMKMAYPAEQAWGAVFITVGPPVVPPRPWKDFSSFGTLTLDLRGETGGESLEIGIKDSTDLDDGMESRVLVSGLSTEWQTYEFPLASFATAALGGLYVVAEFVFSGSASQSVYFNNVRYVP